MRKFLELFSSTRKPLNCKRQKHRVRRVPGSEFDARIGNVRVNRADAYAQALGDFLVA